MDATTGLDIELGYDPNKLLPAGKISTKYDLQPWLPRILIGASLVIFLVGSVLSFQKWVTNERLVTEAKKAIAAANAGKPSIAPSTNKVPSSALGSYSVAPNMPKYLIIPKLNVDARVYAVGLTKSGAIGTPSNVYDTAWYNASSLPGQPGAILIDGHVSSWTTKGVFYGIKSLGAGDQIKLITGDNTTYTYKVVKTQVYSSSNIDMNAVLSPVTSNGRGLNLITCTGDVIAGTNEFNARVVVFAEQV